MKTKAACMLALAVVFGLSLSAFNWSGAPGDQYLPESKFTVKSMLGVNMTHHFATFRLHKGDFQGTPVYYIITDASDFGLAHDLNVNYAPKLANMAIGCPECVQEVTLTTPPGNKFGEAIVNFQGVPDFSPMRVLEAGPMGFPPAKAQPGSVGDAKYSPFIRIQGSSVIYNAAILATGAGPFDVVTHTNTEDRVLYINTETRTIDVLFVKGFDSGQPILYLSTEASDPMAATLERSTFVPLLQKSPFLGGDDFLGAARERIFVMANGQTGNANPQAQGLAHLILDGHATEDASMANAALIGSLRGDGDTLNVQGDFPTLNDPRHANAYSPLWDAQVGMWTPEAVAQGLNKRQTDENAILTLAVKGMITGPDGAPYGSAGFVINCPAIAFLNKEPSADLVPNPLSD
ncbi:MAG: hypothetical protein H0X37_06695 [Herpetosiphonaceae bacterium]|nr:hypothetical protein [Herpetosiphonaceae bacterium]